MTAACFNSRLVLNTVPTEPQWWQPGGGPGKMVRYQRALSGQSVQFDTPNRKAKNNIANCPRASREQLPFYTTSPELREKRSL